MAIPHFSMQSWERTRLATLCGTTGQLFICLFCWFLRKNTILTSLIILKLAPHNSYIPQYYYYGIYELLYITFMQLLTALLEEGMLVR